MKRGNSLDRRIFFPLLSELTFRQELVKSKHLKHKGRYCVGKKVHVCFSDRNELFGQPNISFHNKSFSVE